MAPVRNVPAGTSTRPPPALAHSAMALAIAAVFSVVPSARAPNAVMSNTRLANVGAFTRRAMPAARAQASAEGVWARDARAAANDSALPMNSRRRMVLPDQMQHDLALRRPC